MNMQGIRIESLYTLNEAANKIPGRRNGKKISIKTLERWRTTGVRGIRLRTMLCGGRRFTCDEWLVEFLEASNQAAELKTGVMQTRRTPRQRLRASEEAREQLNAAWKTRSRHGENGEQ